MNHKKAIIIGGGPAGLTAAYQLLKNTDIEPIVLEMSEFWGGISRTETHNGNRIDIGGHRFFSKSNIIMKWWQEILPIAIDSSENASKNETNLELDDNVMLIRKRKSRIFHNKHFFDYPLSLNFQTIKSLGFVHSFLIILSYLKSKIFPIKNVISLEDFFINRFGVRLYKTFFKDYTEKVWGIACNEISAEWGKQRIKGLSITKTILFALKSKFINKKKSISQKNIETSLIEYFLYPKYGPGQMWETVANKIKAKGGILKLNHKVTNINIENNKVKSIVAVNMLNKSTETIDAEYFISSMPVDELINTFSCKVPQKIKKVSDNLQFRDFITVGLLLKDMNYKLKDNWIYIQENYVKLGRIQIFNNWSPFMVKNPDNIWIGLEYFSNIDDELWRLSTNEMTELAIDEMIKLGFINDKNMVLDSKVIKVPKAYPAYFGEYENFGIVRKYVNSIENLFLIGRNGMHKYNNQDHSMLTAIQTVNNIKNKISDKQNIWNINTEEEYYEEK